MKKRKTIVLIVTLLMIALAIIIASIVFTNRFDKPIGEGLNKTSGQKGDGDKGSEKKEPHGLIRLSKTVIDNEAIKIDVASPGKLTLRATLPAEIAINADRMAHIVPRLGGVVVEVRKKLGDSVESGEVMAVMESRELADAKAKYLAAIKRFDLAANNFKRFEKLWEKVAIPEKQYIEIKTTRDEAEIERDSAEQRLRALGFTDIYLKGLPNQPADSLSRYEVTAPFKGTVVQKHITLGEMLKEDVTIFVLADLRTVWINIQVYPGDLPNIRSGQKVSVFMEGWAREIEGTVEYLEPIVGDNTRAAIARTVMENRDGELRPGLFVTAKVSVREVDVPILVPKTALKIVDNKTVVFVRLEDGFQARNVKVGKSDGSNVEIISGLDAGESFVSDGSFILKAELGKNDDMDDH